MCAVKEIGTMNRMGMEALSNGDLMNAEFMLVQALRRAEGLGSQAFSAKLRNNLGLVLVEKGHYEKAQVYFEQALEAVEQRIGKNNKLYAAVEANLHTARTGLAA